MAKSLEVSFFGPPCISENSKIWLKCRWLLQFLADFQLISFTDSGNKLSQNAQRTLDSEAYRESQY